ncbi:hypothetical protein [Ensifer aridi]|uniref:hypothetical protein n=1 Tax=Ensifer aridi TaxID=1708715 RepID=UPI00111169B1|nr:hypothetical protein [Ensifer aridi]
MPESGKSIVRTIFGSYTEAEQFESTPMVHQIFATPGVYESWEWSNPYYSPDWKSLAMAAFGSPTHYAEMLPGTTSLLGLIKALQEQVAQLQADLEQERQERKAADQDLQNQIDAIW